MAENITLIAKSFRVLQILCWLPNFHCKEKRNNHPAAGTSGSTAVFPITSRDRTATILFCHRNWENSISSGCVTYKNIIVCLHSFKAACLSLPGRTCPSVLPEGAGHFWTGTLAHCWGTMGCLTSFSLLHVMSAVRINSRTHCIFFKAPSTRSLRSISSRSRPPGVTGSFCSGCRGCEGRAAPLPGWCHPWSHVPSHLLPPQPLWVSSELFFQLEPDYFIMSSVWKNLQRGQCLIPKSFQKC